MPATQAFREPSIGFVASIVAAFTFVVEIIEETRKLRARVGNRVTEEM